MSREKPAPKLKLPDAVASEGVGKKMELPLSAETILTSANLAEKVAHGEKLSKEDVAELMKKSAGDLKKQGVTITDEDIQHASDAAYASLQAPNIDIDKELGLTEKELTPPNLSEYRKTLESVMKTYQLDKGKWNSIAALLGVNELAGAVVEGKRNYALTYGLANQMKILDEAATLAGMDTIKVQDWRQSIQKLKDEPGNTKKFLKLVGKGSWPIWSMGAQWLVQGGISQYANRLYMKERAKLEDMVNTRVAASLFMGDFSKYHDMPASTMMQVINRGKDATVELVATTHFDLVSAAAQTVGYPLGQLFAAEKPMNWIASGFALAKMGIAGPSAFARAREKHVTNARELKIWEDINQELMTTLTNIETVRTSGKAHEGAVMLKETLADKDYVGAGGLQQQMQRDRWMNLAFDVMDVSLPLATFGLDVRDGMRDEENPLTLKGLFTHLWSLGGNIRYVKGEQMIARQAIQRLSQLYIDRITPYIEDVRRMEELLGPYDQLDMPGGEQEEKRVGVDALKTFDISVKDLSYKNILHHVNLEIPQGTFTAIKGPSGIGKTTLLRHLVGLYRPDKGLVAVGGVSTEGIKKYGDQALIHHIGYAGQSSEFLEGWTLRENLMLGAGEIPEQKVLSVMHDLGLDHLKDRLDSTVKHYSGGEKRRIGIARALLKDPKVLVLDEPTANLDAVSTQQVLDIIHKLRVKRPDMTVLAITHDPAFERIAEQVVDFAQVNKKPSIPVTLNDRQVLEAVAKAPTGKH